MTASQTQAVCKRGLHASRAEPDGKLWDKPVTLTTGRCIVHRTTGKRLMGISPPIHYKSGTENHSSGSQHT